MQSLFYTAALRHFHNLKKKDLIKFMLPRQMGRKKKMDPRISTIFFFFWNKEFENNTDNNTDLSAAL